MFTIKQEEWVAEVILIDINAKYVFVTYSEPNTPGHHHVNCEEKPYWIELFEKYGFSFRQDLTDTSKTFSTMEREFWMNRGLIFINHNG